MIFFGLDIGSTGCKCVAFSEDGVQLAVSYREYPSSAGQSDIDANEMFGYACDVISECASSNNVKKDDIAAISVTSFGESFVPIDQSGNELAHLIMYTDKRGAEECDAIVNKVGYDDIMHITCTKPDPMYSLPKIAWLMKTMPEIRQKVYKFLLVADYICYKLSGETKINYSLACRTMAFDVENLCWSPKMLESIGITADMLSEPVPCGSIVGVVHKELSLKLGIPASAQIVISAHDQISSAIGAGVLNPGEAVDGTGSVECITPVFDGIIRGEDFTGRNFVCIPHAAAPGLFATYAFNFSGGVLLKWFRDRFAGNLKQEAESKNVSVYRLLDELCPDSPNDVIVVPHFMGAGGTPDLVASAKGTITGMTMETNLYDIYRSVLEGLTFEMLYNMEMLEKCNIKIDKLRATGGGARSPVWLKIKADILGRTVTPLKTQEAGAAGCAMLAAVALGKYNNLHEAAKYFVKLGTPYEPSSEFTSFYADKYEKYKTIRNNMLNLF